MATPLLITGAGGLIGTWLRRRLEHEPESVVAVGRNDADLLRAGAPTALIEDIRPKAVVHLAWSASSDPDYRQSESNARWVEATLELYAACRRHDVTLWATGTVVDRNTEAADAYARSKSELRRRLADDIEKGELGWLRPYYVFDEVAGRPSLIAAALQARQRGETLVLRNPDAEHDFIHAKDVASAVALVVHHRLLGELPIGLGATHRVSDCANALGVRWRSAESGAGPSAAAQQAADISRLTAIGWSPISTQEFFSHG